MKKALLTFALALPAALVFALPSQAGHPCCGPFGAGCFCTKMFSGIHSHGPLYNYGPYPYGYPPADVGGGCDDGCGMPWKNGCGLFNWKCWSGPGLFHKCHGNDCDTGCDVGCDKGCSTGGKHGKCGLGCGLFGKHHGSGCGSACPTDCAAPCDGPCASAPIAAPAPAAAYGHPSIDPRAMMAYGSYNANPYAAYYGAPAYGSVNANGFAPAYVAPKPTIVPVSHAAGYSSVNGR